ncbi:glutamine--scyllo-inositol transaminase [Candidatus Nitrosopumilus koreensis AR1]|uniref:Glutamine--scyllo-inositol transaminase n=1 Tax=Candidatus Nitrosopumilus koreensis AR1 TaxID=1229908 RepID=K0B1Y9_9ARCH|nr:MULTISPECIES: DegT/DnrJ/EryC1/StrS family aminotransferase [Nitrosopumilus]AFS80028.1 glutamine--scyllo-inositol transaminase [Candidatus Nitrosopumilus koreensis AR1]
MKKKIKLFEVNSDQQEKNVINQVLKSGFWASGSGVGNVNRFEEKFSKYIGSKFSVAVNSGTAALHLALSLIDLKNKEVILPSLSFVSTAHAVVYNGGRPIFADVDSKTLCIDPENIKSHISKKTRVILPVHFGGMACNLDTIKKICKDNNIILIEDAAHAAGASYKKKKIGVHGDAVCFSFHPVKNLAMPNGGAITLNNKSSLKSRKNLLTKRWCGISNRKGSTYDITELGWNYYMNEFSAAIGLKQLKKLDKVNKIRKKIAKRYCEEITVENKMPFNYECSYHLFWIRVKNREKFMKEMNRNGIETGIHYNPIHKMTFYAQKQKLKITEEVGKEIVSIPMHPNLTENNVDFIIKNINKSKYV